MPGSWRHLCLHTSGTASSWAGICRTEGRAARCHTPPGGQALEPPTGPHSARWQSAWPPPPPSSLGALCTPGICRVSARLLCLPAGIAEGRPRIPASELEYEGSIAPQLRVSLKQPPPHAAACVRPLAPVITWSTSYTATRPPPSCERWPAQQGSIHQSTSAAAMRKCAAAVPGSISTCTMPPAHLWQASLCGLPRPPCR